MYYVAEVIIFFFAFSKEERSSRMTNVELFQLLISGYLPFLIIPQEMSSVINDIQSETNTSAHRQ